MEGEGGTSLTHLLQPPLHWIIEISFVICPQKMDACDPNDDKFMFKVSRVNASSRYSTIKSLKTGMFLVNDTHGNASMRKIKPQRLGDQEIKDREAWFELIDGDVEMDAMMAIDSEDISSTAKTCEACEVESMRATA